MDASAALAATVDVEVRVEIAVITQTGRLGSMSEARETQRRIEADLIGRSVRYGLFDNRATLPPSERVRRCMWDWLQSGRLFERVALVLQSVAHSRRLNLSAVTHNIPVRVFSDVDPATDWLLTSETWPQSDLLVFEDGDIPYAVPAESVAEIMAWTEPLPIPGARSEGDSLLGDELMGLVERAGVLVAVRRARRARAAGSSQAPTRLIVFERDWGGFALPATRTHVVGRVQLAHAVEHDGDVDSSIGLLRFLDPRRLVGGPT